MLQEEGECYIGVPVDAATLNKQYTSADGFVVDLDQFHRAACILGLLLGLLTQSAQMGSEVFVYKVNGALLRSGENATLAFLLGWSLVSCFAVWIIVSLIRRLIMMIYMGNDAAHLEDVIAILEGTCLTMTYVGICIGYAIVDSFFLPMTTVCTNVGVMGLSIVFYHFVSSCLAALDRKNHPIVKGKNGQWKIA